MKRLIILCLVLIALACKEEQPKIDYALISGKIENPVGEAVAVFKGNKLINKIALNDDGTFADTLKIKDGYYTLRQGREATAMYITQGDNIKINLDTKSFDETISYDGIGSKNNNYLASKFLEEEKKPLNFSEIYAMDEGEFLNMMNEVKSTKIATLKSVEGLSPEFRALEEKQIEYEHLNFLYNYKSYHGYYAKKQDFTPSESFMKTLADIDYSNEDDYNTVDNYKNLVITHYMNKITTSDAPAEIFNELKTNGFDALKKDLSTNLLYSISPSNEQNEAFYNGIMAMSSDDKFKEGLTTKYNKIKKLAKGMPSPEFESYENHKGGTTSLKDLRGQYVYIDVWATWCGPCIREIPSLQKVEKDFHGKNIAFVSTSIDRAKDHNTWVEMVKEKELGGIQLMADKDWGSDFVRDYAIEGIPRFILVDPNGNIVSADAPRPSDPKLVELLNELSI